MEHTIQNNSLIVKIKSKGAELSSVFHKGTKLEYMWDGDPAFWGKTSPILFPIVGTLKNNMFIYEDKSYALSRHGFARDAIFTVKEEHEDRIVFEFASTDSLQVHYPFPFVLQLTYSLKGEELHVSYSVENTSPDDMYFSLGAHPAFKVPLTEGTTYEDYFLLFNKPENAPRWPISAEGLIETTPQPFLHDTDILPLKKSLFHQDAIVFKNLLSNQVSLRSNVHDHGLDFHFEGFPYLGIWAAKDANFVCIEPWYGIADSVTHDQQLTTKEGIKKLFGKGLWLRTWKAKFF